MYALGLSIATEFTKLFSAELVIDVKTALDK
jgi:hypothetical protein